jgi:hypothetical protein
MHSRAMRRCATDVITAPPTWSAQEHGDASLFPGGVSHVSTDSQEEVAYHVWALAHEDRDVLVGGKAEPVHVEGVAVPGE